MSKEPIPLAAPDISQFARRVAQQLKDHESLPSHLGLLNMLARAAGFQNYQHMRRPAPRRRAWRPLPRQKMRITALWSGR